jgi:hypothetical protein
MFFRQLSVQLVGERYDACWVCPEGEEAACFSRGTRGDGLRFDDGDFVQRGVEEWMSRQEVGGCAANDAASCRPSVNPLLVSIESRTHRQSQCFSVAAQPLSRASLK